MYGGLAQVCAGLQHLWRPETSRCVLNTSCGESQSPNGDRAPAFSRRNALSSHASSPSARLCANSTQIIDNGWDGFQTQIGANVTQINDSALVEGYEHKLEMVGWRGIFNTVTRKFHANIRGRK